MSNDNDDMVTALREFLGDMTSKEKTAFLLGFTFAGDQLVTAVDVVEAAIMPITGGGSSADN